MRHFMQVSAAVLMLALASAAHAQEAPGSNGDKTDKLKSDRREFAGLDLGVGISVTFDTGSTERISDAEVVNGVVRVVDEDDVRARIMLESHYFFTPDFGIFNVEAEDWGIGPFVAVQPGTDEMIEAAAMGLMIGFRRKDSPSSFNVGIGLVVDPNTQVLGDGIVRDEPLPAGETDVRFREESQLGVVLVTSFTF